MFMNFFENFIIMIERCINIPIIYDDTCSRVFGLQMYVKREHKVRQKLRNKEGNKGHCKSLIKLFRSLVVNF